MKVKLSGVTYKSGPEEIGGSCTGCAACGNDSLCTSICDSTASACRREPLIWAEKVPKTFEYEGKTYRAKREKVTGKCDGCAFSHPQFDCGGPLKAAVAAGMKGCRGNECIYVEVKKREPVEPEPVPSSVVTLPNGTYCVTVDFVLNTGTAEEARALASKLINCGSQVLGMTDEAESQRVLSMTVHP